MIAFCHLTRCERVLAISAEPHSIALFLMADCKSSSSAAEALYASPTSSDLLRLQEGRGNEFHKSHQGYCKQRMFGEN